MPITQTEYTLTFHAIDVPPPADVWLFVDRATDRGFEWVVVHSSQPWPAGAFRWALAPEHDTRDT